MPPPRFAVAVTCIDGRVQRPTVDHLRRRHGFDYVDLVTEPGPELVLSDAGEMRIREAIRAKIAFSLSAHDAEMIALTAHAGCSANDADDAVRAEQLTTAVAVIQGWFPSVPVAGFWLDGAGRIEPAGDVPRPPAARQPAAAPVPGPAAKPKAAPAGDDLPGWLLPGLVGFLLGHRAGRKPD